MLIPSDALLRSHLGPVISITLNCEPPGRVRDRTRDRRGDGVHPDHVPNPKSLFEWACLADPYLIPQ